MAATHRSTKRIVLLVALLGLNAWAGACDIAPNFHDALQLEFKKELGPCPVTQSTANQHCLILKETPQQILKRLPEYANWPGARRYEWHYGDLERGLFYDHYHLSIKPLKAGSLVILQEETGPIVALSQNLGRLYKISIPNSSGNGICLIPVELNSVIKSCQKVNIVRENANLPALQLTFSKPFGKTIIAGKTYLYYHDGICPIIKFEAVS